MQFLRRFAHSAYFVSPVVLDEISACDEDVRSQIMEVVAAAEPTLLEVTTEAIELARFYIDSGILPARKVEDALHVAVSTIHQMDVLVSWNHRHMANVRKTEQYQGANLLKGYSKTPLILTPLEVLYG